MYKVEKRNNIQTVRSFREHSQKENYERRLLIREQLEIGNQKKWEFMNQKRENAKKE